MLIVLPSRIVMRFTNVVNCLPNTESHLGSQFLKESGVESGCFSLDLGSTTFLTVCLGKVPFLPKSCVK